VEVETHDGCSVAEVFDAAIYTSLCTSAIVAMAWVDGAFFCTSEEVCRI